VEQGKRILAAAWARAVLEGRAKPFVAPEAKISPPGEKMLQISASAQTVLLSKVAVGRVWDAEPAENAPALAGGILLWQEGV